MNKKIRLIVSTFLFSALLCVIGGISCLAISDGEISKGESAYEIAVRNGFVGTEVEWLASLKGTDGEDGQNGQDGKNGQSAYQIAVENGYEGSESEWISENSNSNNINADDMVDALFSKYKKEYGNITYDEFLEKYLNPSEEDSEESGVTVESLYEKYKEVYGDELTYKEFLEKYISSDGEEEVKAMNKALLSTALVYTEFYENNSNTKEIGVYQGSAVIWKIEEEYTYFVTNYHVIYDESAYLAYNETYFPKSIKLYLYGSFFKVLKTSVKDSKGCYQYSYYGDYIECEYVGGSASTDLAIIKGKTEDVLEANIEVEAVTLAEGYKICETAYAVGNSEGKGLSVTKGIVSVGSEKITLDIDQQREFRELRIDTVIYHGNSGGGLFNSKGQLIGITNAGDGTDQSINYAIPISVVNGMIENLLYYCKNSDLTNGSKILLGVTITSSNIRYSYDEEMGYGKIVEKMTVTAINEGGISQQIGLKINDLILSFKINNVEYKIDRSYDIGDLILTLRVGDKISFKCVRDNGQMWTEKYEIKNTDLITIE